MSMKLPLRIDLYHYNTTIVVYKAKASLGLVRQILKLDLTRLVP